MVEFDIVSDNSVGSSNPILLGLGSIDNLFVFHLLLLFFLRFYLFARERERAQARGAAGRGRGRSRLPTEQGARCRTQSQDLGIMTGAEGRGLTN